MATTRGPDPNPGAGPGAGPVVGPAGGVLLDHFVAEHRRLATQLQLLVAKLPAGRGSGGPTRSDATIRLRRAPRFDPLTGLLNRAAIEDRLAESLVTQPTDTLVVLIDLDGFGRVNERHGSDAGDAVLEEVARRLSLAVRPEDAVGRHGGDQFVVVCRGASVAASELITARLATALSGDVVFEGGAWTVRATIGTAQPDPGEDPAAVLCRAEGVVAEHKRLRRERSPRSGHLRAV